MEHGDDTMTEEIMMDRQNYSLSERAISIEL